MDERVREESERRYSLSEGALLDGRTWGYVLSDLSRANIRALVGDPAVEDTQDIQRAEFRVSPSAQRRPVPSASHPWIPGALWAVTVLCLFIGLFGISVGLVDRAAPGTTATWFTHRNDADSGWLQSKSWDLTSGGADPARARMWSVVAVGLAMPLVLVFCWMLWSLPYTLSEAVATFETVSRLPAASFLVPSSSYYRPLFYITMSVLWNGAESVDAALMAVRFVHIVPVATLILLLVWHVRPKTPIDAAAAIVAVTVLLGSPGFVDNLELPLSYTIVGMAAALLVWTLLERDNRSWHGPAIVALTLVAIGFKEQGLVLVPLVVSAWWVGSPGVGRSTAATVAVIGVAYVVFRLSLHDPSLPQFEQDVGLGFGSLTASEVEARFGSFPLWIYAYSAASTISNVLFAEPTGGVFRIVRAMSEGQPVPWHFVHLFSSLSLTVLVVWWGGGALSRAVNRTWSPEARLFIVTLVAVLACGALSFNYSRDRLGGMAVVFYALSAYAAVRAAATRAVHAPPAITVVTALVLLLIAGAWQLRATYAIEFVRDRAATVQRDWMTELHLRRIEFAEQPEYLRIMQEMTEQGTNPTARQSTAYPRWMVRMLGEL